jgi:ABC-type transporter Mla subunit MlaD
VTELGDFSDNFGSLLANNSTQIDRIVANLNAIVAEVKVKLPALDSILGGLDESAKRLALSSRYGEWLNNNIYCGAAMNPPQVESNTCTSSLPNSGPSSQSKGTAAVTQILTGSLSG